MVKCPLHSFFFLTTHSFMKKYKSLDFSLYIYFQHDFEYSFLHRSIFLRFEISQYFEWILYYVWNYLFSTRIVYFFLKIIRWYKMHKLVNSKGEKHSPRISQFSCVWFRARGKCSFFLNCRVLKNIISSAEKV